MKRYSAFRTILEITTIIGYIAIAMTILTYIIRGVAFDRIALGAVVASVGACELLEFFTLKHLVKLKNIPLLVVGALELIFGVVLIFLKIDLYLTCVILGWCEIGFSVIKIANYVFNIPTSPFINIIRMILDVIMIVFSIILVVKIEVALNSHMIYMCVLLILMAVLYLVEIIIRHSRNG